MIYQPRMNRLVSEKEVSPIIFGYAGLTTSEEESSTKSFPQSLPWYLRLMGLSPDLWRQKRTSPTDVSAATVSGVLELQEISEFRREVITTLSVVEYEEERVEQIIANIRGFDMAAANEIAARLLTLLEDAKEEDVNIDSKSLDNFYHFLDQNRDIRCPSISLTPDNRIYVSWKDEGGRLFSVHFLSGIEVRFVIFKPNPKHFGSEIRISGTATSDVLRNIALDEGILDLISI